MLFVKNPSKISVKRNLLVIKLEEYVMYIAKQHRGNNKKTETNCSSI